MDRLIEIMRSVDLAAPPSSLDLDALIARERRRGVRVRWLAGTGALAVAAVLVAAGPAVYQNLIAAAGNGPVTAGHGERCADRIAGATNEAPAPRPVRDPAVPPVVESAASAIPRLSTVLRNALAAGLPSGVDIENQSTCDATVTVEGSPDIGYVSSLRLTDVDGYSSLFVRIDAARIPAESQCTKNDALTSCHRATGTDGSVTYTLSRHYAGGAMEYQYEVYRIDGSMVLVSVNNYTMTQDLRHGSGVTVTATRPEPLLTPDQLVAIAGTPGLTVYP